MLAKITTKNQLTLPKAVMQQMGKPEYVNVSLEDGRIILTPVQVQPADTVRNKLAALGITEQDVKDAVSWGRGAKA
jgi:antitoxin component of MazEF toxin-antitoxin module